MRRVSGVPSRRVCLDGASAVERKPFERPSNARPSVSTRVSFVRSVGRSLDRRRRPPRSGKLDEDLSEPSLDGVRGKMQQVFQPVDFAADPVEDDRHQDDAREEGRRHQSHDPPVDVLPPRRWRSLVVVVGIDFVVHAPPTPQRAAIELGDLRVLVDGGQRGGRRRRGDRFRGPPSQQRRSSPVVRVVLRDRGVDVVAAAAAAAAVDPPVEEERNTDHCQGRRRRVQQAIAKQVVIVLVHEGTDRMNHRTKLIIATL
mmetsp:Transcript_13662/g.32042  ORF Transcript_13662/g.32042 Transcript_13662/m.32042 type:complete len:257 (+) Transcript_13662:1000-1770(+)